MEGSAMIHREDRELQYPGVSARRDPTPNKQQQRGLLYQLPPRLYAQPTTTKYGVFGCAVVGIGLVLLLYFPIVFFYDSIR